MTPRALAGPRGGDSDAREGAASPALYDDGALVVNERSATLRNQELELRVCELRLLRELAGEPDRVFTKEELRRRVWPSGGMGTRTLDTNAVRLRDKLAVLGDRYVVNVWGVGYRLRDASH